MGVASGNARQFLGPRDARAAEVRFAMMTDSVLRIA